jgi:dolichol-phosphate mannosyltransferase
VGFRQVGVSFARDARHAGKPKYTFAALVRLAIDGLVSCGGTPLTLVAYLGVLSLLVAFGLTGWLLAGGWSSQTTPQGLGTLAAVVYMGSVQLLSLGVIAEYLRRIFLEVKGRPTYIIGRVTRQGQEPSHANQLPACGRGRVPGGAGARPGPARAAAPGAFGD